MVYFGRFIFADTKNFGEEVAFGPDDAMYGLAWCAADGTNGEALRRLFDVAVVALGFTLFPISVRSDPGDCASLIPS